MHLSVISKRWPDIAKKIMSVDISNAKIQLVEDKQRTMVYEAIQIASSFDQDSEAQIQIKAIPINCTQLTLYGTGLGAVQRRLLNNNNIHQLNVVIMNISLFKAALTHFNQTDWLEHPKVKLILADDTHRINSPFIALPAELVLADNTSARLRDMLCLTLDTPFIEAKKGQGNQKLLNKIIHNQQYIKQDNNVSDLFKDKGTDNDLLKGSDERKFIICGAGPTLATHLSWLANIVDRQNFFIVAVDAAVMPLATVGVIPDLVVSIDPVAKKLFAQLAMENYKATPLVYFPVLDSQFLDSWLGDRYVAYSTGTLYDNINIELPVGRLYSGGSVIHPAVDLAVKMGAQNIFLLGCDFSFPDGKTHTFWQEDSSTTAFHVSANNTSHWVLNGKNERVPTLLNFRGYLRDLEQYIALTQGVKFYNTSDKGALILGTTLILETVQILETAQILDTTLRHS